MTKKVLLISTSAGMMGTNPTGLWISELAEPYAVFTKAGFDVTIASIAGGAIPIDAGSMAEPYFGADAKAFMHNATAVGALHHSVKVDASMAGQYDAVCLCGGHGTCVDFYGPSAAALKAVVEGTYAAGKVVGAVCHGPIGLIECNAPNGTPLVAGHEVTCFSDVEEGQVGQTEAVKPFSSSNEQGLTGKGGKYSKGDPWTSHVVTAAGGKLITGQNPQSAEEFAQVVVKALA